MLERLSRKALLSALRRDGVISASQEVDALAHFGTPDRVVRVPWFVSTLQGLGGWISACLVLLAMFLMFGDRVGIFALPLCGLGLWIERRGARSPFFLQAALSLVLIGAGLGVNLTGSLLVDVFGDRGQGSVWQLWSGAFVIVSIVLCYLTRSGLVRGIMLSAACVSSIFGLSAFLPGPLFNSGASVGLLVCVSAWICLSLDESRARRRFQRVYGPLTAALLCTALILLAGELGMRDTLVDNTQHLWILSIGLIALVLWVLRRILVDLERDPTGRQAILIQVSGVVTATCLSLSPGAIFSLIVSLVAIRSGSRRLLGIALISLIGFLAQFYYALEFSLLLKSGTLSGAGMVMLLMGRRFYKLSAR